MNNRPLNPLVSRIALALSIVIGAALAVAAAAAPDSTYAVGQKVEVSFLGKWVSGTVVSTDGNWPKVHFVDGNGRDHEQPVPPSRLRTLGGNPATPNTVVPQQPGAGPATVPAVGSNPAGTSAQTKPNVALTQGDLSALVDITPTAGAAAAGQIPADPVVWPSPPSVKPITLKPRNRDEFFEKIGALLFADKLPQAVVTYVNVAPGKDPSWRIERCDLATGVSLGVSAPVSGDPHALALSPSGTRLFTIAHEGRVGMNDIAQVWTIDTKTPGAGLQALLSWKPYAAEQSLGREITWAGFVDSDHVLTTSREGKVILWQVAAAQAHAVFSAKMDQGSTPALSGGRKYLALPIEKTLFFLDPLTGKLLGRLESDSLSRATISFRPDGKQVAAVMPGQFIVWDLGIGGAPVCDFSSTRNDSGSLAWASDGFVVLDSKYLVDLSRNLVLWSYRLAGRGGSELVGSSPGRFWYITEASARGRGAATPGSSRSVLVPAALPEDAVLKVSAGLKVEDISLLRPGSKVALAVNVDAPDDMKQKITKALSVALTGNGLTIADDAPVKLEASTAVSDSKEITYRVGAREEKVNVTGMIYRLAFTSEGQTAWERVSKTGPPLLVRIQAGQTAQQAVDAARKPNYVFFLKASLPKVVPKPGRTTGWGESDLTDSGPQPIATHSGAP